MIIPLLFSSLMAVFFLVAWVILLRDFKALNDKLRKMGAIMLSTSEHLQALAERATHSEIKNKETGEVLDLKYFDNYIFPEELTSLGGALRDGVVESSEKKGQSDADWSDNVGYP